MLSNEDRAINDREKKAADGRRLMPGTDTGVMDFGASPARAERAGPAPAKGRHTNSKTPRVLGCEERLYLQGAHRFTMRLLAGETASGPTLTGQHQHPATAFRLSCESLLPLQACRRNILVPRHSQSL